MADQKISELTAITGANTADDDLLVIVDTSTGETKKITRAELFKNTPALDVTGTATMDGLTVDNNNVFGGITLNGANAPALKLNDTTDNAYCHIATNNGGRLLLQADAGNIAAGSAIELEVDGKEFLKVDSTGDISFYEDTGTTAKFFWDASAESLGIGTTSPSRIAHLYSTSNPALRIDSGLASAVDIGVATSAGALMSGSGVGDLVIARNGAYNMNFATNNTERMRIDSSGNVGIGTSAPAYKLDVWTGSFNSSVAHFTGANAGRGLLLSTFARGSNDDSIDYDVPFAGGVQTWSIAGTERMRLDSAGHLIVPNGITLGTAVGVYDAAKTLDDYEEGTWTPTITGITVGSGTFSGNYAKVGRMVQVQGIFTVAGDTTMGNMVVSLPFANIGTNHGVGAVNFTDSGVGYHDGLCRASGTANLEIIGLSGSSTREQAISTTYPMTWAAGDTVHVSFTYQTS